MALNATVVPTKIGGVVAITLLKLIRNESKIDNGSLDVAFELEEKTPFSTLYIAWLCVAAVIFIPGLLANGMIIFALFKVEKLRIASNYLIGSLAVADLMMMAIMVSFVLSDVFQVDIPFYLFPSLDILVGSASIINLAGVSFDRATAVMRPFHYHDTINLRKTLLAIKCIWIYAFAIFILGMLRQVIASEAYHLTVLYIAYFFGFFVPCIVIVVSYALILYATVKNVKLSRSVAKAVYNAAANLNDESKTNFSRSRHLRIQEIKMAGNFMVILLPFLAGWSFFFCTSFHELVVGHYVRSSLYEWFLLVVPWVSSSINPVVYLLSTASLRKTCLKLICKGKPLARAKESIMTTLQSKRNSTAERRASQSSEAKAPFLERLNPLNFNFKKTKAGYNNAGSVKTLEENRVPLNTQFSHQSKKRSVEKLEEADKGCLLVCNTVPKSTGLRKIIKDQQHDIAL